MKKHLYLSGFMGAGKSRIGRELAAKTGRPFYDSDKWIEEREGKTVKEIFEQEGEPYFRKKEKEALRKLAALDHPAIIALGGGVILDEENRSVLKESGITVYIKSSPQAIFERVRHSNKRPLLAVDEQDDFDRALLERIRTLLTGREHLYRQADVIIDRDVMELPQIVNTILRLSGL